MIRSAPPSPTHHPFITDLNIKEHENTFIIRPNTAATTHTHFTLPSFLPRLPFSASHSLPASPNRLPHHGPTPGNFSSHTLRFYPMGLSSASTEALALETRRIREENDSLPDNKRLKLSNELDKTNDNHSKSPLLQQKSVIMGGGSQPLLAPPTATPHCFQLAPRFPFVGMPLMAAQPPQIMSTSSSYIPTMQAPPTVQAPPTLKSPPTVDKEQNEDKQEAEPANET